MGNDIRVLLVVGGEWHDSPERRAALSGFLSPKFDLTITDDLDVLHPDSLSAYDVIANYTTFLEPTEQQIAALLDAVEGGKGFVGIHSAAASFLNSSAYLEMLGGKFVAADPLKTLTVKIGTAREVEEHPITQGVDDFEIFDELYIIEGDITQWHVLARTEGHAVLYTKTWGKGRVHCNALGDDVPALSHPSFQTLLINGVEWAAGRR